MRKLSAFAAALLCAAAPVAASAQDMCWTQDELAAARVRDLQSVLMVAALQCRNSGHDVLAQYNSFVIAGRETITRQNDVLKARFVRLHGAREGQRQYDRFTTALANDHSADARNGFCGSMTVLAAEATQAARAGDAADALELVAGHVAERPFGVGDDCRIATAQR